MSTKTFTANKETYEIEVPYAEGHVLTATEAEALNAHFVASVRNNSARVLKDLQDAGPAERQAAIQAYAKIFKFGHAGIRKTSTSPLEKEILHLATKDIKELIRASGDKICNYSKEQIDRFVAEHLAEQGAALRTRAQNILNAKQQRAEGGPATAPTQAPAV